MQRKLLVLLFLTALVPGLVFGAGRGKIRGKVTDAATGEVLIGANVVVTGTSAGAATNAAGEYTILNVEAGTYQMKATYVGYQTITINNVRVSSDLTTEQNFQLPPEGVQVATVEITAERPLVNKNATNAVRIIDNEFFKNLPARGVGAAVAAQPGVVVQGGAVYIRGSRPDEVGYRVEGVNATDIINGGSGLYTTAEAVEQIQVQAGGFNAEYGGANAGLVQSTFRTGSPDRWKASLIGETDRYAKYGKKSLGGYSYGYSDLTGTFGGPVTSNAIRFFGAVQNTFYRDPSVTVREPYSFKNVVTDPVLSFAHQTGASTDTIPLLALGGNPVGGMNNRYAYSGSLLFDLGTFQARLAGSYSYVESRDQTTFANLLNQSRLTLRQGWDGFGNLKLTYVVSPTAFLEVNGNYYYNGARQMDPDFKSSLFLYGDSTANAKLGYHLLATGSNYAAYGVYNGAFTLNQPGTQIAGFGKQKTTAFGGRVDFTTQFKQHELKAGGEYTRYTVRRYNPTGVRSWARLKAEATSPAELENLLNKSAGIGSDIIGYDIFGAEVNSDVVRDGAIWYLAPPHPVFAAAYVQDKIEFSDLVLNLGLRFDYIDPSSLDTRDPGNLGFNAEDWVLASSVQKTEATKQISPRIGFSFPVTDRTVFHAQYGKFIQQSRLNDSYRGMGTISGNIKGGFWVAGPNGWGLKPERTTQYELGFSQQISDFASFDVTAFYKDIRDQIQFMMVTPSGPSTPTYSTLANLDFSTAKGLEFKFTMRRTNRVSAQLSYTFADARSTASNQSASNGVWQLGLGPNSLPRTVFPTDFSQAHRGTVILDYRYGKNDGGPILSELGLNLMLNFNSGHPMTRLDAQQAGSNPGDARFRIPLEPINASTTPWFFQLDARVDKTVPIGPLDVNFFVYVINLLGTDNPVNSFIRTNDPSNDGWLTSNNGKVAVENLGQGYVDMYNALFNGRNSGNFGPPRQIRFGLRLDY